MMPQTKKMSCLGVTESILLYLFHRTTLDLFFNSIYGEEILPYLPFGGVPCAKQKAQKVLIKNQVYQTSSKDSFNHYNKNGFKLFNFLASVIPDAPRFEFWWESTFAKEQPKVVWLAVLEVF